MEIGGNANAIWLEKGDYKILFDIKIKTPKGALFCAYFKRKEKRGGNNSEEKW